MAIDVDKIYSRIKGRQSKYDEEEHCKLLLKLMSHPQTCRISAFLKEAFISDNTFYEWVNKYEIFRECYYLGKALSRELWEDEGYELRNRIIPPGTVDHAFEYWKMIGWSRFGISKNSRIKLHLNPDDSPSQHYAQVLRQAREGDFTAAEIKQLMEAVNVGLNSHQSLELQKQIDQLKSDLVTMNENTNVQNSFTNKGIEKKD